MDLKYFFTLRLVVIFIWAQIVNSLHPKNMRTNCRTTVTNQVEITNLKKENLLLKHKCQKLEREQKNIKERLYKWRMFNWTKN